MKPTRLIIFVFVCLFQTSCATIMKQEWEQLIIETKPAGAVVNLSNGVSCHTPCTLELDRGDSYAVKIKKPGYKEYDVNVKGNSWDGWLFGNLVFVFGMPIAVAVDFYTGYAYDFSPDKINVSLQKE